MCLFYFVTFDGIVQRRACSRHSKKVGKQKENKRENMYGLMFDTRPRCGLIRARCSAEVDETGSRGATAPAVDAQSGERASESYSSKQGFTASHL